MKKIIPFLLLAAFPFAAMADNNEQKIETEIASVVIYLSGAEVTHTKSLTLLPGRNELHFIGLSSHLVPKSIQFTSTGDVSLLAISNKIDYIFGQKKNDVAVKQILDSLVTMSDALAIIQGTISAYESELQMINSNYSIGGADKGVAPADLKLGADFVFQRTNEINTELVKLRRKQYTQQEIVNRLNMQYSEANRRSNPPMAEIIVLVNVNAAMKLESNVTLRYVVSDCGWAPSYDLIAEDVDKPIELKYRAKVYNNTDVDWKNIKMKLSTSNPMKSATAPELTKWTLNFESTNTYANGNYYYQQQAAQPQYDYQAQPQALTQQNLWNSTPAQEQIGYTMGGVAQVSYTTNMDVVITDAAYNRKATYQPLKAQQYSQIQISELSADFDIKLRYDIPSDAKPYIVDVTQYNLNATFQHHSVPKMDRDAYLLARITGWEELDLVEGPANVYFGGIYVGQSYIQTQSVEDTLDLSLGRDQKIIVSRTKLKELNSEKPSSTTKKETYSYEIAVRNTRKASTVVKVQDQIPVSQETEIIVEATQLTKGELDPATGIITWNLNIPAGETMKVVLTYTVRYPKNKAVNTQKRYKAVSAPKF
jgi:Domain of unknown function (DUF4139)/N-terminal domain of unknown function (DUF4140)